MAAAAARESTERPAGREPLPAEEGWTEPLRRRARRLEVATTAWNVGEVGATLTLGLLSGSLALVAFGLDSLVEVFASLVVLWHLGDLHRPGRSRRAERLVALAFVVLGGYLAAAGLHGLAAPSAPARSPAGIGFLAATVVAMVALARAKRRVALSLSSAPLLANATMALLDGGLAAGVLAALVLDLVASWWWADPVAALVVAAVALEEGTRGWRAS